MPDRRHASRIAVRRFAGPRAFAAQFDKPVRVVQLTDQHFGKVTPHLLQKAAARTVNEQSPDLVVLTGDYVAHSLDYLDHLEEVLSSIQAPKIAVLGNHDHWNGADKVRAALRRAGVEILDNAHTEITLQGQRLSIVGIDDAHTGHSDVERATRGLDPNQAILALSHIAEEADALWQRGASLVLSGHTHSGQITLGDLHHIVLGRFGGHRYVHGLYGCRDEERAEGAVYVSAGIGASVFGLRLGDRGRPEVAVFELGHAPGSLDEHHSEQPAHPGRRPDKSRAERLLHSEKRLARKLRWQKLKRGIGRRHG